VTEDARDESGSPQLALALPGGPDASPSLVRVLLERMERQFSRIARLDRHQEGATGPARLENLHQVAISDFITRGYLRRRAPDEIESVLTTLDANAMDLIRRAFEEQPLGMQQFVEAIVRTGTYDADRIVAFIGGVVDLFYEVLRSQADRAIPGQVPGTVNWAQVMNHFIECPEIAMFEGSEGGMLGTKVASSTAKQPTVQRNNFVDRAKHQSCGIDKIYWNNYVDALVTVEGNESVYFFSPHAPGLDSPLAVLTPHLGPDFYDHEDEPLYHVQAVAWDEEMQDLSVVLSNRMLIMWRLRNREKCQWQQKRELRFEAVRKEVRGIEKAPTWDVRIVTVDGQTGGELQGAKKPSPETESAMRRSLGEARQADEAATQLDIWWNQYLRCWITTDATGSLFLWNLRALEGAFLDPFLSPKKVLREHTKLVTSHLELNKNKFTTCSLDRSVILWDHRNLTPEMKLQGTGAHSASVLSQAYLPRFNSLVTVACEKKVFVWTIDSTAFRGMKAKLSGHSANVMRVSAGQKVFFTLDEAFNGILWDGSTLVSLQTINLSTIVPRQCTCVPEHGTICLSGRRLNFVEGNEAAAEKLGKPLTKEQQAKTLAKHKEGASLKESAAPRFCGLAESRASILSATEVEVRLHARGNPGLSRALFNAPEGEFINAFQASDKLSCAVFGTSKGAIHFVKYRSGFALKSYPGKREGEDWQASAATGAADGGGEGEDADGGKKKKNRGRFGTNQSATIESSGRGSSPTAAGNHSPKSAGNNKGAASPQGAAAPFGSPTPGDSAEGFARGGAGGGDEDGGAPPAEVRRQVAVRSSETSQRTAPTPEEAMKGLSSNVTSVLMCEDQGRVYVGTNEGQVLVFTTEEGFPVLRWMNSPEGPGPVTCLHCGPEAAGLLAVGTQGGSVHLYKLPNFRLAGSVSVAKLMFESDAAAQGAALKHVRLFSVAADPDLPLTLVTVDIFSRFRLWGLNVHESSGKLKDLRLIMDGGQLREVDCIPESARPKGRDRKTKAAAKKAAPSKTDLPEPKGEASGSTAAASAAAVSSEAEGAVQFVLERGLSHDFVQVSALTMIEGLVQLPTRSLAKQPAEGPVSVDAKDDCGPEKAAELAAALDPKKRKEKDEAALAEKAIFVTAVGAGGGAASPKGEAADPVFVGFDEEMEDPGAEFSGSDTDGDADEIVGRRVWRRPPSPKPPVPPAGESAEAWAARSAPQVCDGGRLLWVADTGGWIWCLDVAGTVETAVSRSPPVGVILDTTGAGGAAKSAGATVKRSTLHNSRPSIRLPTAGLGSTVARRGGGGDGDDHGGPMLSRPLSTIKAQPDAFRVVGAWPAHLTAVQSLVAVSAPSSLVSTDTTKDVKVWSTSGDLWGHFSLRSVEGERAPVAIWPPPHVLAAQVSLMRQSKSLCQRMGFHTNREDEIKVLEERRREAKKAQADRLARQQRGESNASQETPTLELRDCFLSSSTAGYVSPMAGERSRLPTDSAMAEDLGFGGGEPTPSASSPSTKRRGVARQGGTRARPDSAGSGGGGGGGRDAAAAKAEAAGDAVAQGGNALAAHAEQDGDGDKGSQAGDESPAASGHGGVRRKKRTFTQEQLSEMLRSHAFSSGCQTYKQFMRKVRSEGMLVKPPQGENARSGSAPLGGIEGSRHEKRGTQLGRPSSAASLRKSPAVTTLPPIDKVHSTASLGGARGRGGTKSQAQL